MATNDEVPDAPPPLNDGTASSSTQLYQSLLNTGSIGDSYKRRVEEITRLNGYSGIRTHITDGFMGTNVFTTHTPTQIDNSQYGLVFFTRPRMNLSRSNIVRERTLHPLLTTDDKSDMAAIRCYLDPESHRLGKISSRKVLTDSPWIHLLGNQAISMNGWPDLIADTEKSKAGLYQEQWAMYDSFPRHFGTWDASLTFRNQTGNPIFHMFNYWTQYGARVHEGSLDPWPDSIFENELDYDTRIFVFVFDFTRTKIAGVASTIAMPVVNPTGEFFNFDRSKQQFDNLTELSYQFTCMGAEYNDPILLREFNDITCMFNESMMDKTRNTIFQKIEARYLQYFNYLAIPWIDINKNEIEWYVRKDLYQQVLEMGKTNGYVQRNPNNLK